MSKNQIDKVISKINKNLMGVEELRLIEKVLKYRVHSFNNFLGWKPKFPKV